MAITRAETQVTWSTNDSVSVTAGGNQTSDVVTLDPTCVQAAITLKADNSTSPASDDIIYCWWQASAGDPDGAGSNEYPTQGQFLAALDTSDADPSIITVPLPVVPQDGRLYAEGATAGTTNAVTVSATIEEMRSA